MRLMLGVLPWAALALLLIEFTLSNDLPAPAVRRTFLGLGAALLTLAVVAARLASGVFSTNAIVAAGGPLSFLVLHELLRRGFRRLKGAEPSLVSGTGQAGGASSRFFFQPEVERDVTWLDYAYSFLLGAGMLVAAGGAIAVLIERG